MSTRIKYARVSSGLSKRTAVSAATALPGSSAYTAGTAVDVPDGSVWACFALTYVSAAALGGFKFKVLGHNGVEEKPLPILEPSTAKTDALMQQAIRPGEYLGPIPGSGNTAELMVQVRVAGLRKVKLIAADVTATPGMLAVAVTFQ